MVKKIRLIKRQMCMREKLKKAPQRAITALIRRLQKLVIIE